MVFHEERALAGVVPDQQLAQELAEEAGEILLGMQSEAAQAGTPADDGAVPERTLGKALGTDGDQRSEQYLRAALAWSRPADSVLSEEGIDDPRRLEARRVWIIDPLDGTREYSEGRADWAVHVALWVDGALVAGAVALPGLRKVYGAASRTSGKPAHTPLRIAVSRSRAPRIATDVAELLGAELVPMGSAGYKACAVVRGEVDAYLHDGGQYEWDSAAPAAVARSAGLHVSRLDGTGPQYNQPDPYLPDLLVCRPELAESLLSAIGDTRLVGIGTGKAGQ